MWKGYHDFQSLYMKGLLDEDKKLQIEALRGLIEASKRLGLDATRYRNALKTLHPAPFIKKPKTPVFAKTSQRPKAPLGKPVTQPRKEGYRRVEVAAPLPSGKPRSIKKVEIRNHTLYLKLSAPFSKQNIRHFVLEKRMRHLYVFDVKPAKLPYTIKRIRGSYFKEIRIAQYNPKQVRIVVETGKSYKPFWKIEGNTLMIALPGSGLEAVPKGAKSKRSKPETTIPKPVAAAAKPKRVERASHPQSDAKAAYLNRRYTVVIDPGHGGKDSGAVGYNRLKEKNAVLAIAKEAAAILKKRGFRVYMTRNRDIFIPLKKRTRYANLKHADLFISIHANAAPRKSLWRKSYGIETYFLSPARSNRAKRVAAIENRTEIKNIDRYTKNAYLSVLNREKIIESNKFAIDLQRQMLLSLRKRYRHVVDNGVREGPFWVLVGAQMPAVLIETGFITNPMEAKRLFDRRYQRLMAEGIANGVESYLYHNR